MLIIILMFSFVVNQGFSQTVDTCYIILQETDRFFVKKSTSRRHPERIDFLFDKKPDKLIRSLFYHDKESMEEAQLISRKEFDSYSFECACELYWYASKNPDNYMIYIIEEKENGEVWKYPVKVEFPPPPPPMGPSHPNIDIDKIKKPPPVSELPPQTEPIHCN